VAIGIGIGAALGVASRGGPAPSPTAFVAPTGTAGSLPPAATGTPEPSNGSSVAPSGAVRVDPTLLGVLPVMVAGNPVSESPEAETPAAADPSLAGTVDRLVIGLGHDATMANWAFSSVVALKPGAFSDAFFRDWRDSYDTGACSQAGGTTGTSAQAPMGQYEVYIGRCAGGVSTYHVRLGARNLIVSITALGPDRYGELTIQGLRP
jgi:hypothetical protein